MLMSEDLGTDHVKLESPSIFPKKSFFARPLEGGGWAPCLPPCLRQWCREQDAWGQLGGRRAAFLLRAWGVASASVSCAGPAAVAVALLRVGWLNVRSSALLDLHLRFCILDAVLMYFSC